jgi:hypothetical protein
MKEVGGLGGVVLWVLFCFNEMIFVSLKFDKQ